MPENDAFWRKYGHLTLGSLPRLMRISARCLRCDRHNDVPVAYLIAVGQVDPRMQLAELERSLRCAVCNSRRVALTLETPPRDPRPPAGVPLPPPPGSTVVAFKARRARR